jgi:hypothetical protein
MHVQCPKKAAIASFHSLCIDAIGLSTARILVNNQKNKPLKGFQHTTLTVRRCPVAVCFLLYPYYEGFYIERENRRESFD